MMQRNTVHTLSVMLCLHLCLNNVKSLKVMKTEWLVLARYHAGNNCYHLRQRCEEEVEILGNEMKNAVKFYVNDIRNLQSVKEDDYFVGDIACVKKEVELQKVRLAILASTFQQFTNVQKLIHKR